MSNQFELHRGRVRRYLATHLTFLVVTATGLCAAGSDNPKHKTPAASETQAAEYVIGPDDVLAINVWKEPEISRSVPVRPDGKISLPLVGELTAGGLITVKLRDSIT